MSFDEGLLERLRDVMADTPGVSEKKMFGGMCVMVHGNMCCGIMDETLMERVGPDQYLQCLEVDHAREMDFSGKPLKGMVYDDPDGIAEDEDLEVWVGPVHELHEFSPP